MNTLPCIALARIERVSYWSPDLSGQAAVISMSSPMRRHPWSRELSLLPPPCQAPAGGGVCPERCRLLAEWNRTLNRFADAVGDLHAVAGTGQPTRFSAITDQVLQLRDETRSAWKEYEKHTGKHGCG